MNKPTKKIFDRLTQYMKAANKHEEPDAELLEMAAHVRNELNQLQEFVNLHGTTYESINRTGEVMHKHRPQHQQLTEARTRYLTILRDLGLTPAARARVTVVEQEEDELQNLLSAK